MPHEAILIHGVGSSTEHTWERNGWFDLLDELGVTCTPFALPGHTDSPLAADAPIDDIVTSILESNPAAQTIIGFSAGASLALHAALAAPDRIRTLVLLGIGDGFWAADESSGATAEALRTPGGIPFIRLLRGTIAATGNSVEDVALYIEKNPGPPPLNELAKISARTLVVCGDRDPVGPPTAMSERLSDCRVEMVARVDHQRTPSAMSTMAAVQRFLG